jgi:hypothetical protein
MELGHLRCFIATAAEESLTCTLIAAAQRLE